MLLAHAKYPATYSHVLLQPVWQRALQWINNIPTDLGDGEHEIEGRKMYANLHTATLVPRTQGAYEAHKNYIDLQYCLGGGEIIEWMPVELLTSLTAYDTEKDYTLYELPGAATSCRFLPDMFAVFFPGDAHMPKIQDGGHTFVQKVVIKIHLDLLK